MYLSLKIFFFVSFLVCCSLEAIIVKSDDTVASSSPKTVPCVCGVFLSGQFTRGSSAPPKGNPVLLHEYNEPYACNLIGQKQCTNKCLEVMVKYLPNSPTIVCSSIDRDCHKERAYLFVMNCNESWINTNLSAGREYCCKDNVSLKCPILPVI